MDDEGHHNTPQVPISKTAAAAIKAKIRALQNRPIKKVAEAKARKKFKAAKIMAKIRDKSGLAEAEDLGDDPEKAKDLEKLMKRGMRRIASLKKGRKVQTVVAKGGNRALQGRPKGVKGRYKMVDPRMRKEMRAEKRIEKKNKKKRR
jgi:AdoMet-dependent rRNA methyltransferase SPB1